MAFLQSPGVQVREIDLTAVVPSVATSIGAIVLAAQKGPVSSIVDISSEEELEKVFGTPNSSNFESWFCASSFLQYANALKVVRAESGVTNAASGGTGVLIRDNDHYLESYSTGQGSSGDFVARTAGTWGNSLGVSVCASGAAYNVSLGGNNQVNDAAAAVGDTTITVDDVDTSGAEINVGDIISFFTDSAGSTPVSGEEGQEYEVTAIDTSTDIVTFRRKDDPDGRGLKTAIPDDSYIRRKWRFYDLFDIEPSQSDWSKANGRGAGDELHIVVYDTTGDISGYDVDTAGNRTNAVLETYSGLSKSNVAKTVQGGTNYYADVIFNRSEYIYWTDHNTLGTNWGTDTTSTYASPVNPIVSALSGAADDYALTNGELALAYDKFRDTESVDVNLIMGGSSNVTADTAANADTHGTMLIDLAELRRDCVAFISPHRAATVNVTSTITQTDNVIEVADSLPSSSYAVMDSGYKFIFDKYNDVYRYVPLNGDTAGLCAFTDNVADAFFSPAGFNRGNVRGAIKLSYNPDQADRDRLYRARVNPVVNFPGQGVVLFGDKTMLTKPSAFDRINVRRLFLLLEDAISTASKFQLFEFNDEFTRAQFRNLVEPFLRDIQGRRGITDFRVVADETNNTGEVIDRNEFVADIFIKPARSINFIQLNFIATRTGVEFSEVAGV